MHRLLTVAGVGLSIGCAASSPPTPTRDLAALDGVTSSIIGHPITTTSADARTHFLAGQREQDLGRNFDRTLVVIERVEIAAEILLALPGEKVRLRIGRSRRDRMTDDRAGDAVERGEIASGSGR